MSAVPWRSLLVACLLLGLGVFASVASAEEAGTTDERFDCRELTSRAAPESPSDWFERSLWAGHCYVFEAQAVRIGLDGVRTLSIAHEIHDGVEVEQVEFLDGAPLAFERRAGIGRLSWAEEGAEVPTSPAGIVDHLDDHYRLRLAGHERIADRRTVRLDIDPLDSLRFGHRLWLDVETGLPLKQVLMDDEGRAIETFQFSEITPPRLHQGHLVLDRRRPPPGDGWSPGWLPDGFVAQPVQTRGTMRHDAVTHRLYSDGLSSLSLFVEPTDDDDLLVPGMHRLGISHAAVRHRDVGGRRHQVVAMGELPPRVLLRVADSLEWRDDPAASVNDDNTNLSRRRSKP
jgi:sigma-E factor negative regulatory protein RseB